MDEEVFSDYLSDLDLPGEKWSDIVEYNYEVHNLATKSIPVVVVDNDSGGGNGGIKMSLGLGIGLGVTAAIAIAAAIILLGRK